MWVWGPYYLKRFKISSSHVPNSPDGSPPTKKDYDVGDKELLAIKLSLEEWHHWLEQAEHPFLIWTDHKNLTYLKSAKRFNFPQARWSLLFARFNFSVSYGPGSRNINLNTLSHQSSPDLEPQDPATFPLPFTWEVEEAIHQGLQEEPGPQIYASSKKPTTCQLPWVEYAHNTLTPRHRGRGNQYLVNWEECNLEEHSSGSPGLSSWTHL